MGSSEVPSEHTGFGMNSKIMDLTLSVILLLLPLQTFLTGQLTLLT